MTLLVNGAWYYDEPGALVGVEEDGETLASNVAALEYDVPDLVAAKHAPGARQ